MENRNIWLTWEDHRRSRELAEAVGAEYCPLISHRARALRYPVLIWKTVVLLLRVRPSLVFCQNPSIVLAAFICRLKSIFGFHVVVDRHSNLKLETVNSRKLVWRLFHYFSKWTVKKADITIVTNKFLFDLVESWGGRPYILQDKFPVMKPTADGSSLSFMRDGEKRQVMFVTTFSDDEPVEEVFSAGQALDNYVFYLTGNYGKAVAEQRKSELARSGVVLTGFIGSQDYIDLMDKVDIVVVLTTKENLLTCGAYEALALRKPLVLSDTEALRGYFGDSAVYVKPEAAAIVRGLRHADGISAEMMAYLDIALPKMEAQWCTNFRELEKKVGELSEAVKVGA